MSDDAMGIARREFEEKTFWADVQRAFEQAFTDESTSQKAETGLWDRASDRDFRDEQW